MNKEYVISEWFKHETAIRKIISNTVTVNSNPYISFDDVYQATFELAIKYPNKFSNPDFFYSNIKQLAKNSIITELRRMRKFKMTNLNANEHGYEHNKTLKKVPCFSGLSDIRLDIKNELNEEEYHIYQLITQGYTIAEISEQLGKACQYAITKLKAKLSKHFNIDELDNKQLAYWHVRQTIQADTDKITI